jgi:predicted permease
MSEHEELDGRLNEEIQFHIDQQTEKNVRAGMSLAEARRAAMLKFGGVESAREYTRDEFRWAWLADFGRDVRIALRSLKRTPSFAFAVIVTFGLGIGAASSMFSVYDGVLLKPLPYPEPDRIVRLYQLSEKGTRNNVSEPNFLDWQRATQSFEAMAEFNRWESPVSGISEPVVTYTSNVSRPFFDIMGVRPALGRTFVADEQREGAPNVAVVSSAFWKRMGRDATQPPTNGDTLRIASETFTVVGVMPPSFNFPIGANIWTPREHDPPQTGRTAHNFQAVARLKNGVALARAQADISAVSRSLKPVYKDQTSMSDAAAIPLLEAVTGASREGLSILFVASLLLLVVASANVSNLMVARASSRAKEFAIQLSLGATRGRLVRRSIAEALVLCVSGGALGIVIATIAVRVFAAMGPSSAPRLDSVGVNWTGIAFTLVLSSLVAIVLSVITTAGQKSVNLAPALVDASRTGSGSRRQMRVRQSLIVTELAVTLVLLVGAGLLAKSFRAVMAVDPGFSLDEALVADVTLNWDKPLPQQVAFRDSLLERVKALPGVTAAAYVSDFPLGGTRYANGGFIEMTRSDEFASYEPIRAMSAEERAARGGDAEYRLAGPGYFETMGIPLVRGRFIGAEDGPDAPQVAVISDALAKSKWPDRDPIGRYIQFGNMDGDYRGMRVVGVVGDVRELSPESLAHPMVYGAAQQRPVKASAFSLIVRGPAPATLNDAVRRIARDLDPEAPVKLRTVSGALDAALGARRFNLWLIGAFSAVAFILAALGVYGLISYSVSQRVREIGIRKVLGAENPALVGWIVKSALGLAGIGVAFGLVIAFAVAGVLRSMLFGVQTTDPAVFGAVALLTFATAAAASFLPARRVVRIAPTESLREG